MKTVKSGNGLKETSANTYEASSKQLADFQVQEINGSRDLLISCGLVKNHRRRTPLEVPNHRVLRGPVKGRRDNLISIEVSDAASGVEPEYNHTQYPIL